MAPFASASAQAATARKRRQFARLKGACALTFVLGACCAVAGALLCANAWTGHAPAPHGPGPDPARHAWALAALAAGAGLTLSFGHLARLRMAVVLAALGAATGALLIGLHGGQAAADPGAPAVRHYMRAQAALLAGDQAALRRDGEAVLRLADDWAYGLPSADPLVAGFRPDVVYALDRALNGQPQTHVGIEWERRRTVFSQSPPVPAVSAALGAGLLLAGAALAALWRAMVERVRRIAAVAGQWH